MRLRSHRRNLMAWSQSAGSVGRSGVAPFTRTRRIRRWIRTGALLTIVGLMSLARAGRVRWWFLLAEGVLAVDGVMLHAFVGVVLLVLVSAPFAVVGPRADRIRRSELEPDLGVYSHPAQLRRAIRAMDLHDHRFPGHGPALGGRSSPAILRRRSDPTLPRTRSSQPATPGAPRRRCRRAPRTECLAANATSWSA
jgi:hypothetical protein